MGVGFDAPAAAAWTHGRLLGGDDRTLFTGASIDTRTLEKGQLFVAIRGDQHDAHAFVEGALERGAAGILVEEAWLALLLCPAMAGGFFLAGPLRRRVSDRAIRPLVLGLSLAAAALVLWRSLCCSALWAG